MSSTTPAVTFRLPEGERRQPRKRRRRAEGRRARKEYLIGGCCSSLWLSRSISSTSRSYDTKLLESNNRERFLSCKTHCILSILSTTCCDQYASECVCVRLCVSPKLRLAVIRSVLNQNSSTTYSDRSNSIIACSEHHTRAVPYLSFILSLSRPSAVSVCLTIYLSVCLSCGHSISPFYICARPLCHSALSDIHHTLRSEPPRCNLSSEPNSSSASHAVPGSQCHSITHMHHALPKLLAAVHPLTPRVRVPEPFFPFPCAPSLLLRHHKSRFDGLFRAETRPGVGKGLSPRSSPELTLF